ncbi:LPXTG-motif cell wall anchor domain protein [gamma proteobacterium NOR5-3]|nr:LPXTG-motif cell wall anchor domain protein [gamma proteobacterium NOR5-3]
MKAHVIGAAIAIAMSAQSWAQDAAPGCDDLVWSAQVLAANPDIALSCKGVYVRNNQLYAKVTIELTRVRGNRITFRPEHTDGSQGARRSIRVSNSWRADIDGREYRAAELSPGQKLSVYIPEDRFALAVDDGDFDGDEELIRIEEEATVVAMPKTASSVYATLAAGLAFLGLGVIMTTRRRLRRAKA